MKILFDQGTPVPLKQHLTGHIVKTAYEEGWSNYRMEIYSRLLKRLVTSYS